MGLVGYIYATMAITAPFTAVDSFLLPTPVASRGSIAPPLRLTSEFGGIQHAGVIVSDTQASKEFYINVLGFEDDTALRPGDKLPFKGAFVRAGPTQIHLMELPNPDPVTGRPEHGGRDRHVAFTIEDLGPLKDRLDNAGVVYTMSKSGRAALFCRDLDGNAFEFIQQKISE